MLNKTGSIHSCYKKSELKYKILLDKWDFTGDNVVMKTTVLKQDFSLTELGSPKKSKRKEVMNLKAALVRPQPLSYKRSLE